MEREFAKKNKTFMIPGEERLVKRKLGKVTQADWASCVRRAVKLQEDYYVKELGRDEISEPIVIHSQENETENDEREDHDNDDNSSGEGEDDDDNRPLVTPLE